MGKLGTNYVLLGIAMATILGVFAIATSTTTVSTLSSSDNMPYLLGHVTVIVSDSDGNIKSYLQTDNTVTTEGLDCAMSLLFADQTGTPCGSAADFQYIVLGSDNDGGAAAAIGDLTAEVVATEVARALGSGEQNGPIVILNNTFTAVAEAGSTIALEAGEVVGETALFDTAGQGTGNMLARVTLPLTEVVENDEIFIEWTITGSIVPP